MKRFKSDNGQKLVYESYDRLMAGWTVPYQQHKITTSYGITHVITAGSSDLPPLLLLHGTGDNVAMMWIYHVAELSRNFQIIAVDNLGGSGKSEPNDRYAHDFNQAKWLDEILKAMNVDATYIAGVSYGARDQDLLSYYPKAVSRLKANGMRYRIVNGVGHAINHEMPDLVHEEIIGFCREA